MARFSSAAAVRLDAADQPPVPDGRGRGAHLSRERIIQGAIALLDADGPSGLSMRRLADNLDAGAMSLYWYIPTKDDLLKLAADTVLAEIPLESRPDDWRSASRFLALELRRVVRRHPWLTLLLTIQPSVGPNGFALIETMLATLAQAGLTGADLDTAMTTLYGYVLGLAIGETVWDSAVTERLSVTVDDRRETTPERSTLASFLATANGIIGDDRFAAGLDLVLEGIAAGLSGRQNHVPAAADASVPG